MVVVGSGWIVEDMPHIQNAGSDGSAQVECACGCVLRVVDIGSSQLDLRIVL